MHNETRVDGPLTKTAQVSVRIPSHVDEWLRRRAGRHRTKADVVRELIEAEMAREEIERRREMFDAAARQLTAEDREDRDLVLGSFPDRE